MAEEVCGLEENNAKSARVGTEVAGTADKGGRGSEQRRKYRSNVESYEGEDTGEQEEQQ